MASIDALNDSFGHLTADILALPSCPGKLGLLEKASLLASSIFDQMDAKGLQSPDQKRAFLEGVGGLDGRIEHYRKIAQKLWFCRSGRGDPLCKDCTVQR